jgi:hypothetical protein
MSGESEKGELTRIIKLRPLPGETVLVEANETERAALARRFALPSVDSLRADIALENDGSSVLARGQLKAQIVQNCAVSGDEFAVSIDEPVLLRFTQARSANANEEDEEMEIELTEENCDEIEFSGDALNLGEAIAQSLGLAIDPYAEGPNAEATRKAAGISSDNEPSGPLAEALKGLIRD